MKARRRVRGALETDWSRSQSEFQMGPVPADITSTTPRTPTTRGLTITSATRSGSGLFKLGSTRPERLQAAITHGQRRCGSTPSSSANWRGFCEYLSSSFSTDQSTCAVGGNRTKALDLSRRNELKRSPNTVPKVENQSASILDFLVLHQKCISIEFDDHNPCFHLSPCFRRKIDSPFLKKYVVASKKVFITP